MAGWFYPPPPPIPTRVPEPQGAVPLGNQPPTPIGPGAAYAALRQTWPAESWPTQGSPTVASQLAPAQASAPFPTPYVNYSAVYGVRSAWPPESWPTQVLIGGGVGALTATPFVPPQAVPALTAAIKGILAAWNPGETWPAQTGARIAAQFATVVNPPTYVPAPPRALMAAVRALWPPEDWLAQSECGIAAGFAQIQLPPLYNPWSRVGQLALINSVWPGESWPAQGVKADLAWIPPPVTANPSPPKHFEVLQWPQETWPTQRGAAIAHLFASIPQAVPYISAGQRVEILSSWPPESWPAQRSAVIASLLATPPVITPYTNLALRAALAAAWPPEQWRAQTQAPTAGIVATPAPPPATFVLVSTAVFDIVNAGLEVFIQYATSPTVPAGYVISQLPAALATVPTWTVVTLTVSGGTAAPPGYTGVPTLLGLFAKDATDALQANLLSNDRFLWQVSASPGGTVINQSIAPTLIVPAGTIVQLTLSAGPVRVPPTTTIPLVH